jgi:cytoskeleton protein RodZ
MQTIGERLEEARKRKGISIREASEATKIRSDYLQKFESNTFELNLPYIYVRGFLRSYAHYLKLNPEKLMTDFSALGLNTGRDSRRHDQRESFGRIDLPEPAKVALAEESPAREPAPMTSRVTAPARPVPVTPPTNGGNQQLKLAAIIGTSVLALVVLIFIVVKLSSSSNPSHPTQPLVPTVSTPSVPAGDVMKLIALDNVRIKVVQQSDNQVVFDGDLVRGDERAITKHGKVWVTYDLGRNLLVEIRGQQFKMGLPGYGRSTLE